MLISYSGQHVQHTQKALEQMNVKLAEVVSDVSGVTGMAIIRAILRGEFQSSRPDIVKPCPQGPFRLPFIMLCWGKESG